jgi:competence protein ComEC
VLHKEIPFLRIVIPLCLGIIFGLYFEVSLIAIYILLAIITSSFLLTIYFNSTQVNILFGFILTLTLILCGHLLYSNERYSISKLKQEETEIICTLSDYPEKRENSYRMKVNINCICENNLLKTGKGSLLLYIRKDSSVKSYKPGDILKITCIPEEIRNRGNPCEFDYKFYMENQGIKYVSFISKDDIKGTHFPEKRKLRYKALIIREKIIEMYRNRGIEGGNLALVSAMTVGEKTMLEPEQKESFIKAGVMHIMAVSGLHAVVLSLFVFNILFFLKGRFNILKILIALILLWAFAFVTGLTPSVLRATLMFSFIQAGSLMKRPANTMNSVLASAFVLILIRPSVIFDAGFLLSYSAVIFIIAFYSDLYSRLRFKNWLADKLWQSVAVTLVAQAGTLSLTIMLFNRFPAYFLLTNIIIVPLSSLLIITGCLVPMVYPLIFLSQIIGRFLNFLSGLTEFLTQKASSLPGSTIEGIGMTIPDCIILTAIVSLLCIILINRQYRPVNYFLGLVLLISVVSTARNISEKRSDELIVYNVPGSTVVGIRTGRILNLYSSDGKVVNEVLRHSSTLGLSVENISHAAGPACLQAGRKRILITDLISRELLTTNSPDIVVLAGKKPVIKDCAGLNKYPEFIVLSSETSGLRVTGEQTLQLIKSVYNIRKSGALKMNL